VKTLLDVDREYRAKAQAGTLQQISPRRFNPRNEAWLPVLHTEHALWQFTVFFSNTALAHQLERTRDWVVIYFNTNSYTEGQRGCHGDARNSSRKARRQRPRARVRGVLRATIIQTPRGIVRKSGLGRNRSRSPAQASKICSSGPSQRRRPR
jgi:hypothetical protein